MGRNNKQRRADKQRREDRRAGSRADRPTSPGTGSSAGQDDDSGAEAWQIGPLAVSGARAAAAGRRDDLVAACDALARCSRSVGLDAAANRLGSVFCASLAFVWEGGWQPPEVARAVRRARRGPHADLTVAALGAEETWEKGAAVAMPEVWARQLIELGVQRSTCPTADWLGLWMKRAELPLEDALVVVLETLGVLMSLPVIESLIPRPSAWDGLDVVFGRGRPDDRVLAKIRALLAKAESTGFEAESEALTAKAQELMARHAIDDALARAERSSDEQPTARRLAVDDPYASARSHLLQVVAEANGVRCVWYEQFALMALVGFAADLESVEILFTSLLVQASRAMLARGSVSDERGRSRTRSFRQSFLLAFASRIRERLVLAAAEARQQAETEMGTSLLPVLAGRDREVDERVAAMFPRLRRRSGPSATNELGWRAGRTAAELATLGPEQARLERLDATA